MLTKTDMEVELLIVGAELAQFQELPPFVDNWW